MSILVSKAILKLQFNTTQRLSLYRKIASFTAQGIDLNEAVNQLIYQYKKRSQTAFLAKIMENWSSAMSRGLAFSMAIAPWVPESEVMILRAGEQSGHLSEALDNAIEMTSASVAMKSALKSALSYPSILFVALIALVSMFAVYIIPNLTDLKPPEEWPDSSRSLYDLSMWIVSYGWIALIITVAILASSIYSLPRLQGSLRKYLDYLPPWNIYRAFQSSVFLISISSLMRTGTPLVDAIASISKLSSPYIKGHLTRMIGLMSAGVSTGEAMNTGLLTQNISVDLEIYARLSNLQDTMNHIGREAVKDGVESINTASKSVMYIVLCLITGFIIWAYMAFGALTQSMGNSTY